MIGTPVSLRALSCRHSGTPLTSLQRVRSDHCNRSACHQAAMSRQREQRDADPAATRAAASRGHAGNAAIQAPVVWIPRHQTRLVPNSAAERRAHREHLADLIATISARADAAAAQHLALLPERHVEASRLPHGARGCTLPPTLRSDIRNRYACAALRQVQDDAQCASPPAARLAAMQERGSLSAAELLHTQGFRRRPLRCRRHAPAQSS